MQKPDIVTTIEREGIQLRKAGGTFKGVCPFHPDRSPSFIVNPARQRFHCFGCGAGGDVIDFIMKLRGVTFTGAQEILGMNPDRPRRSQPDPADDNRKKMIQAFNAICRDAGLDFARELRLVRRITSGIETEDDLELRGWAYHDIPLLDHKLDVLQYGNDEDRFNLMRERRSPYEPTPI
jgi:hypothetical protein